LKEININETKKLLRLSIQVNKVFIKLLANAVLQNKWQHCFLALLACHDPGFKMNVKRKRKRKLCFS